MVEEWVEGEEERLMVEEWVEIRGWRSVILQDYYGSRRRASYRVETILSRRAHDRASKST